MSMLIFRPRLMTFFVVCAFLLWTMIMMSARLNNSRPLHQINWLKGEWKKLLSNLSISLSGSPKQLRIPPISSHFYSEDNEHSWKTILFWGQWFKTDWEVRFGPTTPEDLRAAGCPTWRCKFTEDRRNLSKADAVVFRAQEFHDYLKYIRRPSDQRWVWIVGESPISDDGRRYLHTLRGSKLSPFINWTMTHHSESDIGGFFGYFMSINASMPRRPNHMSEHGEALKRHRAALARGDTLQNVMGASWKTFVQRSRIVAFMTSHCATYSRREEYVTMLQKHIPVDRYGGCTKRPCGDSHKPDTCWGDILSKNYSFYMAMENSICIDYATEKLYLALVYKMVPVVWGGSDYDKLLPPHSYINARHYQPRDLAVLLQRLHKDPVAYGRYHLWRGYLKPVLGGNFCELCHRLHTKEAPSHKTDVSKWFEDIGKCIPLPLNMFKSNAWKTVINATDTKSTKSIKSTKSTKSIVTTPK